MSNHDLSRRELARSPPHMAEVQLFHRALNLHQGFALRFPVPFSLPALFLAILFRTLLSALKPMGDGRPHHSREHTATDKHDNDTATD